MSIHGREQFIDATRGLAMLGVMTAHFGWIFSELHPEFGLGLALAKYLDVSAPTFMVISGALLGYVFERRGRKLGAFALKLMDRGLFLLTAGHLLICAAYVAYATGPYGALAFAQITDAIGLAILLGPFLVVRTSAKTRIFIGISLFVTSWVAVGVWLPESSVGQWVKDTLFGAELSRQSRWGYNFPVAPWISVYIVATALGQHMASVRHHSGDLALLRRMLTVGAVLLFSACCVKAVWGMASYSGLAATESAGWPRLLYALTEFHQKRPPGLGFFLYTTSVSLGLLAALFLVERQRILGAPMSLLTAMGRNSLFLFIVQEHVYVSWLWLANPPLASWPLTYSATVIVTLGALWVWRRLGSTALFTVGFGRWWGPRSFDTASEHPAKA